ncbi:unnamed protein product, partial [Closterium sp. NIES-53]
IYNYSLTNFGHSTPVPFYAPPESGYVPNANGSRAVHTAFTVEAVADHLATGTARIAPAGTPLTCVNPLNVIVQPSKKRLILDLRHVNLFLSIPPFRYEELNQVSSDSGPASLGPPFASANASLSTARRAPQARVGFLPVVRPGRASIFSPSRAPSVRRFRARRAPARRAPCCRPRSSYTAPPFSSIPLLHVQQWGGGYGGGGCGARWFYARCTPCCCLRSSYTTPPALPFSSTPLLRVQQWGGGYGGGGCE